MSKPKNYSLRCIFPALPKVERGKAVNLGSDPKKENFLYFNGNNVYIRDIEDCTKCDIYSEHQTPVTVAKYSPSRFYIASGDSNGNVRIWDTVNAEHILKKEYPVLGSVVKDIGWSPDSSKMVIVGEGRGSFGKVINMETGTSVGSVDGHSKPVNAAAFRQDRPFRICTASEDQVARFFEGPPFKCVKSLDDHSNFVNCVKYKPGKGEVFITGGADGKAFVYEGSKGELIGSLGGEKAHNGGIYAMEFSPNGEEVLTVSGDKSAKIWNVASRELVQEFKFGNDLTDMMVGCIWQEGKTAAPGDDNIVVLALSGYFIYLDRNNPSIPRKTLKGHYRPIICLAVTPDKTNIYTGSSDGQIYGWDANTGLCDLIKGKGHSNQIQAMTIVADTLLTIGMDDMFRQTQLEGLDRNQYRGEACKMPSMPKAIAARLRGLSVVACMNHIVVVENCQIMFQQQVKFEPQCVDIHPNGSCAVFGSGDEQDDNIYIYEIDGSSLSNPRKHKVNGAVTCVKFSPDGQYLTVTNTQRRSVLLRFGEQIEEIYALGKQNAKIFSLAWCPNSRYFATGSLDGSIVVWRLDKKYEANVLVYIKEAHPKGIVTGLEWLSENILVSSGNDANMKHWNLQIE